MFSKMRIPCDSLSKIRPNFSSSQKMALSKPIYSLLFSVAGVALLSNAATASGVEEKLPSDDDRIRKLARVEFEPGMGVGTGQHAASDLPDMSDFEDNGFDFAGLRQEGGKTYAVLKYRKTEEMMRRMGPEKAKEFKTVTLDPNNPEDMKKTIYF